MTVSRPSFKSLLIEMSYGDQLLSTGTGVICRSAAGPVLVTNRHNVTGRHNETDLPLSKTGGLPDTITIVHNQYNRPGHWVRRKEPLRDQNDKPRWIEHPTHGSRVDVVALPLSDLSDVILDPYSLADGPRLMVRVAEPVSVVGFPFGLQAGGSLAIWATGFIATEPSIDFRDLPLFLVDCRTRAGQSGSAVIAHRNGGMLAMEDGSAAILEGEATRWLGIYSGRVNADSDLGMVWKAHAVQEIVDSIRPPLPGSSSVDITISIT